MLSSVLLCVSDHISHRVLSRFLSSMLHNPHLGLTGTLEKLYKLAKIMADCVVPQEYGTTVEEKRSIGTKMCGALLEKIKYVLLCCALFGVFSLSYALVLPLLTR